MLAHLRLKCVIRRAILLEVFRTSLTMPICDCWRYFVQAGVGRTDLPGGNTEVLLASIHDKLLSLR